MHCVGIRVGGQASRRHPWWAVLVPVCVFVAVLLFALGRIM
jgi:hypothetical protein